MAFQMELECPGCTATLSIEANPGELIECPGCGTKMQLNAPPPPEPVLPAQPNFLEEFQQAVPEPVENPLASLSRAASRAPSSPAATAAKPPAGKAPAAKGKPGAAPPVAGKPGAAPTAIIEAEPGESEPVDEETAAARRKKMWLIYGGGGGGALVAATVLGMLLLSGGPEPTDKDEQKTAAIKTSEKTETPPTPVASVDAGDGVVELAVWLPPGVKVLGPHRMAHSDFVYAVAFSPDGKLLVSGGADKVVRVWDPDSGRLIRRLVGHTGTVYAVAFAPDGQTFASTGADRSVRVWDAAGGRLLQNMTPPTGERPIRCLAYSADSKMLASAGDDEQVVIWDTSTGAVVRSFGEHKGIITSLAFSPDGEMLAGTCRGDSLVRLFQGPKGNSRYYKLEDHPARPTSVAFSPDGKTLASVDEERHLILFDVSNPKAPRQKRSIKVGGSHGGQFSVAFSPDGQYLAVGGADRTIQVVNASDLTPVRGVGGHTGAIRSISFAKNGLLASAGDDRTVRVWNIRADDKVERFASQEGHTGYVYSAAFLPGAAGIVSVGDDRVLRVWNLKPGSDEPGTVAIPTPHYATIRSVAVTRDGKRAATGSYDMRVMVWNMVERRLEHTIAGPKAHSGEVLCVAFSPDGQVLASGSQDETIRLWDPNTGQEYSAPLVGHRKPVHSIAFSPDGQMFASGADDGGVRLWDPVLARSLHVLGGFTEPVRAVAFSPDGKLLAAGSDDGTVRIWQTASGAEQLALAGLRGAVRGIAFSADGRSVVAGSTLGELVAYDAVDGALVRWAQYATPLESVAPAPDGRTVLTANGNTSLYLVDLSRAGDPSTAMEAAGVDGDAALWVGTLRDDRDVKNLRTAAAGLGRLGKDAPVGALPALIGRLHDDNPQVQTAVSESLAAIGPPAVPALIAAYKTAAADNRRRVAVLNTLGRMGAGALAAAPLLSSALSDRQAEIRAAAAQALGRLGPGAVAAMLPLLTSQDAAVRTAAEGALLDDKMFPFVVKAAGGERDLRTRLTAMAAIAKMGDKAESRAMGVLLENLQDKDAGIRAAAARAVGAVCSGDRDTVEMLALMMSVVEEDRAVRLAAAQALGNFGRPAAPAAAGLLGLFEEPGADELQLIASETLTKLGPLPAEAIPSLLAALDDKRRQVRERIAEVLGNMGVAARDYVAELQKRQLAETDEVVRRMLAEAIRKISAE